MTDLQPVTLKDFLTRKTAQKDVSGLIAVKAVSDAPALVSEFCVKHPVLSDKLGLKALTEKQAATSFVWTMSSEAIDRDGDTIDVKAHKLKNFKNNPVVPWAHSHYSLPIGKCLKVWRDIPKKSSGATARLRGVKQLAVDEYPFAKMVFDLTKAGFLKTASIGFIPYNFEPREKTPDEEERTYAPRGYRIRSSELLESSIVPIPSNPEALVEARTAKGINLDPMKGFLEQALDEAEWRIPILGRDDFEKSWKSAGLERVTIVQPSLEDDADDLIVDEAEVKEAADSTEKVVEPENTDEPETRDVVEPIPVKTLAEELAEALADLDDVASISVTRGKGGDSESFVISKIPGATPEPLETVNTPEEKEASGLLFELVQDEPENPDAETVFELVS